MAGGLASLIEKHGFWTTAIIASQEGLSGLRAAGVVAAPLRRAERQPAEGPAVALGGEQRHGHEHEILRRDDEERAQDQEAAETRAEQIREVHTAKHRLRA